MLIICNGSHLVFEQEQSHYEDDSFVIKNSWEDHHRLFSKDPLYANDVTRRRWKLRSKMEVKLMGFMPYMNSAAHASPVCQ